LNRLQAMAMLKELVDNNLVDPSYVSLGKRTPQITRFKSNVIITKKK